MTQSPSSPICVCHLVLSLDRGGMENGVINVANRIEASGIRSVVICIRRRGEMAARLHGGVAVECLGYERGFHLPGVLRLARALRRYDADILHTHNRATLLWGGLAARLTPGVRHIHGEHGFAQGLRRDSWLVRGLFRRTAAVTAVSGNLVAEIAQVYGNPPSPVEVIPNGVDTERFRPLARSWCFVGRHPRTRGQAVRAENQAPNAEGREPIPAVHDAGSTIELAPRNPASYCQSVSDAEPPPCAMPHAPCELRPTDLPAETAGSMGHDSPAETAGSRRPTTHDPRPTSLRAELGVSPKAVLFACVGRLEPRKNQELAIRALAENVQRPTCNLQRATFNVQRDAWNVERETWNDETSRALILIGDGPDRQRLEALCGELGVSDKVVFLGFRDDVSELLPQIDVLLLPSAWGEGMANVILEANACGVPVLASAIPGNDRLIHEGVNGGLLPVEGGRKDRSTLQVPPSRLQVPGSTTHDPRPTTHGDSGEGESVTAVWAEAMKDLACSPEKRLCMGRAAREHIEREFSLDAMVRRYADLYRRVMG